MPPHTWTCAPAPYPRDSRLSELFTKCAHENSGLIAAIHGERRVSFGELDERSALVACGLAAAGVRAGDAVGMLGPRSAESLITMIAILRAGAVCVPLDPAYPPARLRMMTQDADMRTLVVLPGVRRPAPRHVLVRDLDELTAIASGPPPTPEGTADECAFVLFTSGSTGRPKPVALPHRVISRLALGATGLAPERGERCLHAFSPSFDGSLMEVFWPLLNGGCLVIAEREHLLVPTDLEALLRRAEVTFGGLPTSVFHTVARARPGAFGRMRLLWTGGEALDPTLARRVLAGGAPDVLLNLYGPTEGGVMATGHRVTDVPTTARSVPIGRTLPHTTCLVLGPDGSPATEGEIFIGGDALALGYPGRPDEDRQRFVEYGGERFYRTGDRVRALPDGVLEFLGRTDRQVKVRGHRIGLDEIEAIMRAHPQVGEAVAEVADHDGVGRAVLACFTPADPRAPVTADQLRSYLGARLPAACVPAPLVALDRLPLTPNGKLDRRAMAARVPGSGGSGPGHRQVVAQVWRTVLGEWAGPDDDFSDLGGNSLLASQIVTRTLALFGLDPRHGSALLHHLLLARTMTGYAEGVRALLADGGTGWTPDADQQVDFEGEARLNVAVPEPGGPPPAPGTPRDILLTGATGFIGAFLIDRLLRTTDARLHCPVRARDVAHARRRVVDAAERFGLSVQDPARIIGYPADLARPAMGLTAARHRTLSATVDLVLHNGAQVNFIYPYSALRPTNVDGTREVVRLALPRRVPVHYISTIAVLAGYGTAGTRHVTEDAPLEHADRLSMGYPESKWVAERMLHHAAEAGLPVTVYRPYEVSGDLTNGAWNTDAAICSLFQAITRMGCAPAVGLPLDLIPVDHLADAVVHIATRTTATGVHHLTNPRPALLADMVERLRAAGYPITDLPYQDWVAALIRHVMDDPSAAIAPFVPIFVNTCRKAEITVKEMYFDDVFPTFGRERTERALAGTGLHCPPVDADLLDLYIGYFRSTGYLGERAGRSAVQRPVEG